MGRDISIAISVKDQYSSAVTKMSSVSASFSKNAEGMQKKLDTLTKMQSRLRTDTESLRKTMQDAQKQFRKTGEEADYMAAQLATENYENARRNLKLVSDEAKNTAKQFQSVSDAASKADNRAGILKKSLDSSSPEDTSKGILSSLAGAGIGQMVGSILSESATSIITSAFGSRTGTMFGTTISNIASGAAMGSVAGIKGAAIGAAAGAVSGIISSATYDFSNQNEAYKSAVQEAYTNATNQQAQALESGITLAGSRETTQMAFSTMMKDEEKAKAYLEEVKKMADYTPFLFDDLTEMSKTLLTYGYNEKEMIPQLTKIGDAGAALGMNTEDMKMVATALGRMKSSGKTTLEYINILQDRGINAVGYLAQAGGISQGEVYEQISKGLIPGAEAAKAISEYMGKAYEGAMQLQSTSFEGMQSTLDGLTENLNAAMGAGYTEERKRGMQEQIDFLGGEMAKEQQEAYKAIGQWKASLENEREKAMRDAMISAMQTDAYQKAKAENNGAEMGLIMAKAQIEGENAFKDTEGYKTMVQAEKGLVGNIQNSMKQDKTYWNYGYEMGLEFSRGYLSGRGSTYTSYITPDPRGLEDPTDSLNSALGRESLKNPFASAFNSKAIGIFRVPYDGYPALLHEGEEVRTASAVRGGSSGQGYVIHIHDPVVREEQDFYRLAQQFASALSQQAEIQAG
ncbi:MAG TPA: tape measure protein [Candidatus Fimivicinus intestinavium]|nr:tape measure protein [Candidatus Fimivicinus intestinavium]